MKIKKLGLLKNPGSNNLLTIIEFYNECEKINELIDAHNSKFEDEEKKEHTSKIIVLN